jgi:peptide deformylase
MTLRQIIRYPDPLLAQPAAPVTAFDDGLRQLANDLLETMHAAPGIGITAPHIGVSLRLVVLDLGSAEGARTYVNPQIEWTSTETITHREGSVSMPGVTDEVQRHARVRIAYQDLDGNPHTDIARRHHTPSNDGKFKPQQLRTPGSFEPATSSPNNRKHKHKQPEVRARDEPQRTPALQVPAAWRISGSA